MKRAHGSYRIKVDHQLVICRGYGGWNEVTARQWLQDLRHCVEQAGLTRWSHYVDVSQWQLANPEAIPYLRESVAWAVANGVQYTLIYPGEGLLNQQLMEQLLIYEGDNRSRVVSSPREAETFLTLHGYTLGSDL
ncbi:hypothetical protein [Aestuariirhabdus litorea]|uniref:Uncharacterized protein n=1 Tax=Aestuariirhabdus litorea TaxID=2528527 RepID=A0A3P3VUF3_9GAMM|nr:hypothetical protein [Aestuariirhabdus litorea]RRJ84393.1 hypothetical protein D0544_04605 [Aestuariirhabdus litorea]RWW97617.1 hypothetical protein DZC74_04595 [Endozoicomonadaceae bacterium GTF-13]